MSNNIKIKHLQVCQITSKPNIYKYVK